MSPPLRAQEPKTQSFSALCLLAIAYISSRFARISSNMHIVFPCLSHKTGKMGRLYPIHPPVSSGNREFGELPQAFSPAADCAALRTAAASAAFTPAAEAIASSVARATP